MPYGLTKSADLEAGSSQYFSRADEVALSFTSDFTLEGWFNFESLPASGAEYQLISKWAAFNAYLFRFWNDGGTHKLDIYINDSTDAYERYVKATGTLTTATWYHFAVSWDASAATAEFFLDGASLGTITNTKTNCKDTADIFGIGGQGSGTEYFDGKISLVRAWNITRSATEINANKCLVLGATTGLVGEWTLDDVVTDNSGSGFTLTNNGSTPFVTDTPSVCAVVPGNSNFLQFFGPQPQV